MREGRERPLNLVSLLRETFIALNDLVVVRLAERGHSGVRPSHGAVFQYLDDTGTTVSVLAERAQMTKRAMAELVQHLETRGYVVQVPDPSDRGAPASKARATNRARPQSVQDRSRTRPGDRGPDPERNRRGPDKRPSQDLETIRRDVGL
jgi:hypothetical protein